MKKLLLLISILMLTPFTIAQAQDATAQITQLQTEITERQMKIADLRQQLVTEDTVKFNLDDLLISVQIEVTPYEGLQAYFEDTYVILHVTVENPTDSAVKFDPDGFEMSLADVRQGGVNVIYESMDVQAVPGNTSVEGLVHFNVTEAVSNDKGLLVKYKAGDDVAVEFNVNDYKRMDTEEETVEATKKEEDITLVKAEPEKEQDNLGYQPGDYIVSDVYTGYVNPQGTPVPPEAYYAEGSQEVYDYIEDAYNNDVPGIDYYEEEVYYYDEVIPYVDPWLQQLEVDVALQDWAENFAGE